MGTITMLNQTISDRRAWRADTIEQSESWYFRLTEPCLAELDIWIQDIAGSVTSITESRLSQKAMDVCRNILGPARSTLFQGRGFVVLERVPEHYSVEQANAFYWGIGQLLGQPIAQNIEGTMLYSVHNTGQDIAEGARFSVTNAESSFHTDGAFWDEIPDLIGLLCLATAKSGGESQLISSYAVHNELLENHPDALGALYQDFYFDRRGGFLQGESPVARHPIFHWNDAELTMRYLNYYIHVAHEKVNEPLTEEQENALVAIETLLERPEMRIEFSLQPGQMLFTNNHWILHNRTAFVDHKDFERRRHYVCLWLQNHNNSLDLC